VIPVTALRRRAHVRERLVSGVVVLGGLVGLVGVLYLAIVVGLGRAPSHEERALLVLSMAAAVASALLWVPVRARVQELGRRLSRGPRASLDEIVRRFASRVTRELPLDEILLQLAESLRESLALDAAEMWTGSDGVYERSASDPDRGRARLELTADEESVVVRAGVAGAAWVRTWLPTLVSDRENAVVRVVPAAHGGRLLGLLVVVHGAGGPQLTTGDEQALAELARHVGVVLHSAQLDSALQTTLVELRRQADDLRQSRARVVAAADAERRRIERDLHDGVQQRLVALGLKARLAHELVRGDPTAAADVLAELGSDVERAVDELRTLAHGIYPPLLAQRGLGAALADAGRHAGLPVQVAVETAGRYPPDVESAVYFCCREALQNAAKHCGAGAQVSLAVREVQGALVFEVADDGAGFDPRGARNGAGLTNMVDRVGAIGGRLRVESRPGEGTRVLGTIPIPSRPGRRAPP